jgi:hypothetical protein
MDEVMIRGKKEWIVSGGGWADEGNEQQWRNPEPGERGLLSISIRNLGNELKADMGRIEVDNLAVIFYRA